MAQRQLDKCVICKKTVYLMEKVVFNKKSFHEMCFKCSLCKQRLLVSKCTIENDSLICQKCPKKKITISDGTLSPEGKFFELLTEDVIVYILLCLQHQDMMSIKRVSQRFSNAVREALKQYPVPPIITSFLPTSKDRDGTAYRVSWIQPDSCYDIEEYIVTAHPEKYFEKGPVSFKFGPEIKSAVIDVGAVADWSIDRTVTVTVQSRSGHRCSSSRPKSHVVIIDFIKHRAISCFDGMARIKMANGCKKYAKDIVIGDTVSTGFKDSRATVVQVISTNQVLQKHMVKIDNFWITRGHPVFINDDWYRPDEIWETSERTVKGLYNFVLDKDHSVIAGDHKEILCATIGQDCGPRLTLLYPQQNLDYGPNSPLINRN